jgi:hypothetical protein
MDSKRPEKRVGFFFGNVCRGNAENKSGYFMKLNGIGYPRYSMGIMGLLLSI